MAILGGILAAVGFIMALVYGIILLIKAFKTSVVWGLVSLLVPFGILVFVFMHWPLTKKPFLMWLLGLVLMIIGSVLMGPALAENMPAELQDNMPAIEAR